METQKSVNYIIKKIICSIRKYLVNLTKYQGLPLKNYCKPLIKIQTASTSKPQKLSGNFKKSTQSKTQNLSGNFKKSTQSKTQKISQVGSVSPRKLEA